MQVLKNSCAWVSALEFTDLEFFASRRLGTLAGLLGELPGLIGDLSLNGERVAYWWPLGGVSLL